MQRSCGVVSTGATPLSCACQGYLGSGLHKQFFGNCKFYY